MSCISLELATLTLCFSFVYSVESLGIILERTSLHVDIRFRRWDVHLWCYVRFSCECCSTFREFFLSWTYLILKGNELITNICLLLVICCEEFSSVCIVNRLCVGDFALKEDLLVFLEGCIFLKLRLDIRSSILLSSISTRCLEQLVVVKLWDFPALHGVEITIAFFELLFLKLWNFVDSPWALSWWRSSTQSLCTSLLQCFSL